MHNYDMGPVSDRQTGEPPHYAKCGNCVFYRENEGACNWRWPPIILSILAIMEVNDYERDRVVGVEQDYVCDCWRAK